MVVFLTLNICRKLRISVINSSQWNISLVSIFWVIWRKIMHTRDALDFGGLHKNMNWAFPSSACYSYQTQSAPNVSQKNMRENYYCFSTLFDRSSLLFNSFKIFRGRHGGSYLKSDVLWIMFFFWKVTI